MTRTADEIASHYREECIAWAAAQDDPKSANRVFDRLHSYYKSIKGTSAGQLALVTLLGDDQIPVRLMAATHLLPFKPEKAVPVLEEIEGLGGIFSVDAKYTLMSHRSGRLNLDW